MGVVSDIASLRRVLEPSKYFKYQLYFSLLVVDIKIFLRKIYKRFADYVYNEVRP